MASAKAKSAALVAGALTIASAPGPFAFLEGHDRVPPPRVEHSHVIEAPATAQRLIPAPVSDATEPRPGALPSPPGPPTSVAPPAAAPPEGGRTKENGRNQVTLSSKPGAQSS